jgi:hypothetical protein
MRKIVQITSMFYEDKSVIRPVVHALCDDGTVWEECRDVKTGEFYWVKMPDIPQD